MNFNHLVFSKDSVQLHYMYHDVNELRNFYYRTHLGRSVQRRIQSAVLEHWQDEKGELLIGFGFASPLLRSMRGQFRNVVNLMPEEQGVVSWPSGEPNMSVLCKETSWPLGAVQVDRMIVAHALENTEDIAGLLNEVWRVLSSNGRVLFIVPNRNSVWARGDHTPFGYGRPFSMGQAERLLQRARFDVVSCSTALYAPPMRSRIGFGSYQFWEWLFGKSRGKLFAGALIIEAKKQTGHVPPKLKAREPMFTTGDLIPSAGSAMQYKGFRDKTALSKKNTCSDRS